MSTVTELGARVRATGLRMTDQLARDTLEHWRARGIAEERLGRWRLTNRGRAMFAGFAEFVYPDQDQEAA
jgi:hypothetical protein